MTFTTEDERSEAEQKRWDESLLSNHRWEQVYIPHPEIVLFQGLSVAYEILLECADIEPGMKVFCSDFLPEKAVNVIVKMGGIPVFIDSEYETWNMDPKALECAFERYDNTGIVMLGYLNGVPGKIDEIAEIAASHHACVIEEITEAMGTSYKGKFLGQYGSFAVAALPEWGRGTTAALTVMDIDFRGNLRPTHTVIENPLDFLEALRHGASSGEMRVHRKARLERYRKNRQKMAELLKDSHVSFQFDPYSDLVVDSTYLGLLPDFTDAQGHMELKSELEYITGGAVELPKPLHLRERFQLNDFVVNSNAFRCHCGPGVFVGEGETYVEVSTDLYKRAVSVPIAIR